MINKEVKIVLICIALILILIGINNNKKSCEENTNFELEELDIENNHNSPYRLELISAYGDNDALHPKVLNFENEWNGYKYWMVFSPYPKRDDAKENPHIKVSNDLINWTEPDGFKNPLVGAPNNHTPGVIYNSDPHLTYNYDTDTLECYYRYVNDALDKVIIYRLTTKDGVNWSNKEEVLTAKRSKKDYLSPAIMYDDGIYKMWSVDKNNVLKYRESKDGYTYNNERTIKLTYPLSNLKTWHLDAIKTKNGYELIVSAYTAWADVTSMSLYYFKSNDNINYTKGVYILRPSNISWDNKGIYRSTMIYENDTYYLYYTGISDTLERGIGLSYGKDVRNLKGFNIKKEEKL